MVPVQGKAPPFFRRGLFFFLFFVHIVILNAVKDLIEILRSLRYLRMTCACV